MTWCVGNVWGAWVADYAGGCGELIDFYASIPHADGGPVRVLVM